MGKSRSRLAADWFAKLRVNAITQEVEHEDVVAEQEALDAAEARIASDVVAAKALADSEMATAIAGATMASGDILTSLKTVDGSGSGLDADLLDGQQASSFAQASHTHSYLPLSGGTLTGGLGVTTGATTSLDITDSSGNRTLFRHGRIDAVNVNNSDWRPMYVRGAESYLLHSNGSHLLGINSSGRAIANYSGSRGATGYVLTTPNDSVANLVRQNGYIEIQSNVGAIGISYWLSDKKFKTNIKVYEEEDIIYKFKNITYKSFDWNELSGRLGESEKIGIIAQEVKEIVPEFITEYSDGTLGVNTAIIVTNLMKAVKELSDYNDKLTARIEKLELMQGV